MNATEPSTQEAQKSLLDRLCNPKWPDRRFNRVMLVVVVSYFLAGLAAWEAIVDQALADTLDTLSLAVLAAFWIAGDELISRIPGNEDRQPAFGTRAVGWLRRHWPERTFNRVAVVILIVFIVLPAPLWDAANRYLNGALDYIALQDLLVLWLVGDEYMSRRPGNEDRKPAFATRVQRRLWPYRPRRRFNQVLGIYFLVVVAYAVMTPFAFSSYFIYDASITLEILIPLGIAELWLIYVLARCWIDPACPSVSLLRRIYGIIAYTLLSLLIVVSLVTAVTNEHGLTYLHAAVFAALFGFIIIRTMTPESLLSDKDEVLERRVFPCLAGDSTPHWW